MDTLALTNKLYLLISDKKSLNGKIILNLVKAISQALSAEQRDSTLLILQEVVKKWQQETKGDVPFELSATFELVVKNVLYGKTSSVPFVSIGCFEQFGWIFCRRVADSAVEAAVDALDDVVEDAVDALDDVVEDAVDAVVGAAVDVVEDVVGAAVDEGSVVDDEAVKSVSSVLDTVVQEMDVAVGNVLNSPKLFSQEHAPEPVQLPVNTVVQKTLKKLSKKSDRRE